MCCIVCVTRDTLAVEQVTNKEAGQGAFRPYLLFLEQWSNRKL